MPQGQRSVPSTVTIVHGFDRRRIPALRNLRDARPGGRDEQLWTIRPFVGDQGVGHGTYAARHVRHSYVAGDEVELRRDPADRSAGGGPAPSGAGRHDMPTACAGPASPPANPTTVMIIENVLVIVVTCLVPLDAMPDHPRHSAFLR